MRIWDHVPPELLRLYDKYSAEVSKFGDMMVAELDTFLATPLKQPEQPTQVEELKHERPEISGENAQANAGARPDAAEAPREDESGKAKSRYA